MKKKKRMALAELKLILYLDLAQSRRYANAAWRAGASEAEIEEVFRSANALRLFDAWRWDYPTADYPPPPFERQPVVRGLA